MGLLTIRSQPEHAGRRSWTVRLSPTLNPYNGWPYVNLYLSPWGRYNFGLSAGVYVGGEDRCIGLKLTLFRLYITLSIRNAFPWTMGYLTVAWAKRTEAAQRARGEAAYPWYDLDLFHHARETGFGLSADWIADVEVWRNSMGTWHSRQPFTWPWLTSGWRWSVDLRDAIFGRSVVEKRDAETSQVEVLMPEGRYPATVTVERWRWKRPRWPWARWYWRASIDIPGGIGVAGKGENSWDCGDDATFGCTFAVRDDKPSAGAVAHDMAGSVMRGREKYGLPSHASTGRWPRHVLPHRTIEHEDEAPPTNPSAPPEQVGA
jgi:hypothetical protein